MVKAQNCNLPHGPRIGMSELQFDHLCATLLHRIAPTESQIATKNLYFQGMYLNIFTTWISSIIQMQHCIFYEFCTYFLEEIISNSAVIFTESINYSSSENQQITYFLPKIQSMSSPNICVSLTKPCLLQLPSPSLAQECYKVIGVKLLHYEIK